MPLPATPAAINPAHDSRDRIGIGEVAELLAVPRLTVWWWVKTGRFVDPADEPDGYRRWDRDDVFRWALNHNRAGRVPIRYWPLAGQPAAYRGTQLLTDAVAQLWTIQARRIVLIWPLPNAPHTPNEVWIRQLNEPAHRTHFVVPGFDLNDLTEEQGPSSPHAVLVVTPRFDHAGPELDDAILGENWGTDWTDLATVLGTPVPYWPNRLRDTEALRTWEPPGNTATPDAEPPLIAAIPDIDTAALLQLAATYTPEDPAHQVLTTLAHAAAHQAMITARDHIAHANKTADRHGHTLLIAAHPMPVHEADLDDIDAIIRRLGWLDVLSRRDNLAGRCVREASRWDNGRDFPFGNPEQVLGETPAAREWLTDLKPTARTAAFELLPEPAGDYLTDPRTGAPAVRDTTGVVHATMPRWLPATTPLAEIILDRPIWIRTADDTIWPAPQHPSYGLSWGYPGTGPGTLALLLHRLLDDINNPAPDAATGAPPGLERLTATKMPRGTVLTRQQLQAARGGHFRPRLVFDADTDLNEDLNDEPDGPNDDDLDDHDPEGGDQ
ncbi:MAG: hypothetical protein QOE58_528 [Actinomycetota bacterium]|nr:hypothetical protein [Actinomycetota bacterium]